MKRFHGMMKKNRINTNKQKSAKTNPENTETPEVSDNELEILRQKLENQSIAIKKILNKLIHKNNS